MPGKFHEMSETYGQKINGEDGFNPRALKNFERVLGGEGSESNLTDRNMDDGDNFSPEALGKFEDVLSEGRKEANKEATSDGNEMRDGLTELQKSGLDRITGWSDEIIDNISSVKEAAIYILAGLEEAEIDGKKCLIGNDIDFDQKDEDGITNRERMERGRPPINRNGEEIELHHIGQHQDSPLAELTMQEHRGVGNDAILHDKEKETEIDRAEFAKERRDHWKGRLNTMEGT